VPHPYIHQRPEGERESRETAHRVEEIGIGMRDFQRDDQQGERKAEHHIADSLDPIYFAATKLELQFRH
jgi:hypothetical protein